MASDFSGRASCVIGDQRESYLVESEFARHGLRFVSIPWDNARKVAAVERIRRWLRERTLVLPDQPEPPKLRAELLNFQERITPSGALTYAARGSGHDDRVALLVTAAMAEAEGLLPSSPFAPRRPAGLWNFIPVA
jgi:hypothetical protein